MKICKMVAIDHLLYDYPTHGFVIDFHEASKKLFKNITFAAGDERQLIDLINLKYVRDIVGFLNDPSLLDDHDINNKTVIHTKKITTESNGPIENFGHSFWAFINKILPHIFNKKEDLIPTQIIYKDNHLTHPLEVALLYQIITTLPHISAKTDITLFLSPLDISKKETVNNQWNSDKMRKDILKNLFSDYSIHLKKINSDDDQNHLIINFNNKTSLLIDLDDYLNQCMSKEKLSYMFHANITEQTKEIKQLDKCTIIGKNKKIRIEITPID